MTWQWWWRDFNAQWYRRSDRHAILADFQKTCVHLDLRVGGWLMMWEGSFLFISCLFDDFLSVMIPYQEDVIKNEKFKI